MKVTLPILQRVFEALEGTADRAVGEEENLDPDAHTFFVNAFDMPLWHWSVERSTFEKCVRPGLCLVHLSEIVATQGGTRAYHLRLRRIARLRHPRQTRHHPPDRPPERALLAVHPSLARQRAPAHGTSHHPSTPPSSRLTSAPQLRSTKQLLGRAGERFLLFGMLAHNKEGKLCLEDQDGAVELDFSQLVSRAPAPLVPPHVTPAGE
jgi:DNA polymerase epsilon subunit 2